LNHTALFFAPYGGRKHWQLNPCWHVSLADILELVACQEGKLHIFGILISDLYSYVQYYSHQLLQQRWKHMFVHCIIPSDFFFNMLLHVTFMGQRYAVSSGCIRWLDSGGRNTNCFISW
jgi:hypothetical protein